MEISDPTANTITFIMPAEGVNITANYEVDTTNAADLVANQLNPYINGYTDGTIMPDGDITRAEVVDMLFNLYGDDVEVDTTNLSQFSDVTQDEWYSDALSFGIEYELISGYPDGTFKPNSTITRQELAYILDKFVQQDTTRISTPLTDISDAWAKDSIENMYSLGYITGYGDNTFQPNGTASRAEVVTMMNNVAERPPTWNEEESYPDLSSSHWAYKYMMNAANGSKVD